LLRQPDGTIIDLSTKIEGGVFVPAAINDLGQIAGTVSLPNPIGGEPVDLNGDYYVNILKHVALMQPGRLNPRDLGTLGGVAAPSALNIRGQVVGDSQETLIQSDSGTPYFAVLYAGGKVTNLGTVGVPAVAFESHVLAINDFGQVVGYSDITFYGNLS
jgi:uncharacterized membrane protein